MTTIKKRMLTNIGKKVYYVSGDKVLVINRRGYSSAFRPRRIRTVSNYVVTTNLRHAMAFYRTLKRDSRQIDIRTKNGLALVLRYDS